MDGLLPDEILREILSYNISIPCDAFFSFDVPPLFSPGPRHAYLLLVSKRWLRVGTPLLYECVELSNREHTSTLAELFRAQPHIGQAVRCLRLVGGYGKHLAHIAKLTPRLHSIYINLQIKSCDSIAGLKKALSIFNPVNLYIQENICKPNKNAMEVRTLVHTYVRDVWKSLRTVSLPEGYFEMTPQLVDTLAHCSMEEFICDAGDASSWVTHGQMRSILAAPRLKRVVCRGASLEARVRQDLQEGGYEPAVMDMFTFIRGTRHDRMAYILSLLDQDEDS